MRYISIVKLWNTIQKPRITIYKKFQFTQAVGSGFSELEFLIMLGPLHEEQVLWVISGDWLENSGWTELINNAGVATSATAEAFLSVHHLCKTRYIHQVSASGLFILLKIAYHNYNMTTYNPLDFKAWVEKRRAEQPQADYWYKSMELDLKNLEFVKSVRSANFPQ